MRTQVASSAAPSACDGVMRDLRVFWNVWKVFSGWFQYPVPMLLPLIQISPICPSGNSLALS